jgi:transmembrane sensor
MQYLPIEKLQELSDKWLKGTITTDELELLEEWYNQNPQGRIDWETGDMDERQLGNRLFYNINEIKKANAPASKAFNKAIIYKVAAVMIAILGGVAGYHFLKPAKRYAIVKNIIASPKGIRQESNKAILTLANGSQVILDNANNGLIAKQGNTQVNKTRQGELIYNSDSTPSSVAVPENNVVSTPNGGQYQVSLPDGSKVWLNALTSLKFPTEFSGNERVVELTGEAYFEVAKNKKMPFKVKMLNNTTIEVLGTHFNIMAYTNESSIKATLLEGSINIKKGDMSRMMLPGQQANIAGNIQLTTVNTDEAISWKNGLFSFEKSDIRTVMRQIERWYNVEVVYEGTLSGNEITGYVSRNSNLSEVLKMLELSGLKMVVEGKKIKVYNN